MAGKGTSLSDRFWAKVDMAGDCWLWTASFGPYGYGQFGTPNRRSNRAHRVSWELTHGPIPDGMLVCHTCDNPPCVRPDHLFLGTGADNTADAAVKGRMRRGAAHPRARLTEADVREVRRLLAAGHSDRVVAQRFNVRAPSIHDIKIGKSWAWLQ